MKLATARRMKREGKSPLFLSAANREGYLNYDKFDDCVSPYPKGSANDLHYILGWFEAKRETDERETHA